MFKIKFGVFFDCSHGYGLFRIFRVRHPLTSLTYSGLVDAESWHFVVPSAKWSFLDEQTQTTKIWYGGPFMTLGYIYIIPHAARWALIGLSNHVLIFFGRFYVHHHRCFIKELGWLCIDLIMHYSPLDLIWSFLVWIDQAFYFNLNASLVSPFLHLALPALSVSVLRRYIYHHIDSCAPSFHWLLAQDLSYTSYPWPLSRIARPNVHMWSFFDLHPLPRYYPLMFFKLKSMMNKKNLPAMNRPKTKLVRRWTITGACGLHGLTLVKIYPRMNLKLFMFNTLVHLFNIRTTKYIVLVVLSHVHMYASPIVYVHDQTGTSSLNHLAHFLIGFAGLMIIRVTHNRNCPAQLVSVFL